MSGKDRSTLIMCLGYISLPDFCHNCLSDFDSGKTPPVFSATAFLKGTVIFLN